MQFTLRTFYLCLLLVVPSLCEFSLKGRQSCSDSSYSSCDLSTALSNSNDGGDGSDGSGYDDGGSYGDDDGSYGDDVESSGDSGSSGDDESGSSSGSDSGAVGLYLSEIGELNAESLIKRYSHLRVRQETDNLCCSSTTSCLALGSDSNAIPVCYDSDTTQFNLADGSYGFTNTGEYHDTEGDIFNLITGEYTLKNGTTGNLLAEEDSSASAPTATSTNDKPSDPVSTSGLSGAAGSSHTTTASAPTSTKVTENQSSNTPSTTGSVLGNSATTSAPVPTSSSGAGAYAAIGVKRLMVPLGLGMVFM